MNIPRPGVIVGGLLVVGIVLSTLRFASADSVAHKVGITGLAAASSPMGDHSVMDHTPDVGHDFGGMLRYGITSRMSLGASYDNINLFGKDGERHHPEVVLVNLLVHASPDEKLVPTVQLGVGAASSQKHGYFSNTAARAGFGFDYFFSPNFSAGPQVNYTYIADGSDGVDEYHMFGAGLVASLYFGKTADQAATSSAPPPEPAAETPPPATTPVVAAAVPLAVDSDGDGIFDPGDRCPGTPSRIPVDANGCPKPMEKRMSIELKVLFDTGKSVVKPEYRGEIQQVANFLTTYPDISADIEGYTDSQGADDLNKRLSQRRADAVRAYLIKEFNIMPVRVRATGYGELRPVADNATPEGREKNRRVVATLEAVKVVPPQSR